MAGESKLERARRVKNYAAQQAAVGYTFPGLDPAQVEALAAAKKAAEESGEPLPEPTMEILPLSSEGEMSVTFNQDMLVPADRSAIDYSSLLRFTVKSATDNSLVKARYVATPGALEARRALKSLKNEIADAPGDTEGRRGLADQ